MEQKHEKRVNTRNGFNHPIMLELSFIEAGKTANVKKIGDGVDINSTGVGLKTDHALIKGEVVRLFLPVDAVDANLPVFSEVIWSRPAKGYFRAGLRFLI